MFGFLVALLDDGMAHSVTGFVLLSCNRINNIHSLRTRGSDHWAACTRSFLYSLFSALASWMTPCFRVFSSPSWEQEAVSHPARSASCRWWDGRGLDWIGWRLLCYCRRLCGAKAAVSAGCWGLASFIRTGWDNAAIRPHAARPVCSHFVRKRHPRDQRRHDSFWSFLSTQLHKGSPARSAPNNHPPHALICREGVGCSCVQSSCKDGPAVTSTSLKSQRATCFQL